MLEEKVGRFCFWESSSVQTVWASVESMIASIRTGASSQKTNLRDPRSMYHDSAKTRYISPCMSRETGPHKMRQHVNNIYTPVRPSQTSLNADIVRTPARFHTSLYAVSDQCRPVRPR